MIARLTQWQPREGLDLDHALRAWIEDAVVVERVPGLRRYVQHHAITGPDAGQPPYAGLGEVYFDDLEAAHVALSSPEWSAVIEDVRGFMNLNSVVTAWAEERIARVPS